MSSPEMFPKPEARSVKQEYAPTIPVPEQANFMGNYSELLFSRMRNPVIRGQLLDMLEENEKWMAANPGETTEMKKDPETGELLLDDLGLNIWEKVPAVYVPKTRTQFEQEIEAALTQEMSVTHIDFDKRAEESVGSIIDSDIDENTATNRMASIGLKRDAATSLSADEIRNRSVIEAHEKGHVFRKLRPSGYLGSRFSSAFDFSKISPTVYLGREKREEETDEGIIESAKRYFDPEDPHELIERMAQLKGYFGMKGDEKFTAEHLDYAREHYLKDGMMDNHMRTFFECITPQTEFGFLKLMNSIGV